MINYSINKILVPLDFSETSLNALHTATQMAIRHGAEIMLLNVIEPDNENDNLSEQELQQKQLAQLTRLVDTVSKHDGIVCSLSLASGKVTAEITKAAAQYEADIIVMGTHGLSGYKSDVIGSNANILIDETGCPVLTVPPLKKWMTFKEILFPIRPSAGVVEKYGFIKNIINKNESMLKILGLSNDFESNITMLKSLATELNEEVAKDKVKTSSYFKIGKNLADEVIKISCLLKTDLIVISSNIDSTLQTLFTSSYIRQVINNAKVPVLCLRPLAT